MIIIIWMSKKNIFKYQDKDGIVVLNYDNAITKAAAKEANGKVVFFSSKTKLEDGSKGRYYG